MLKKMVILQSLQLLLLQMIMGLFIQILGRKVGRTLTRSCHIVPCLMERLLRMVMMN